MKVTDDAASDIKTSRLDVTRSFNKLRVTARSVFRVLPQTRLDPAYTDYIQQTPIESIEDCRNNYSCNRVLPPSLNRKAYTSQSRTGC